MIAQRMANRAFRAQEWRTAGKGAGKVETPSLFSCSEKHLETLEVRLGHSGLFNTTVDP